MITESDECDGKRLDTRSFIAVRLDEAISKTDRRMYRDKVAHYEQAGKRERPRHKFDWQVKKSLQKKTGNVKIE